jgi:transmembrane sensor
MQNLSTTPELFKRFLENRSNAAELKALFDYFGTADETELKWLIIEELENDKPYHVEHAEERLAVIHGQLSERIFGNAKSTVVRKLLYSLIVKVAAIFFVIASVGLLIYRWGNHTPPVLPGGTRADLIVNGTAQNLTGQKNKVLYKSDAVNITTKADGTIVYTAYNADSLTASKMNILETPRGGEYRVVLSDGSVVMLNAGSRLSFPTGFRGRERHVTLQGEAFFEVAKNTEMPFIVDVDGNAIRVLGTKFNVSSYEEDQGITATLLEGSIRFTDKNQQQIILKPNQQVNSQAGKLTLAEVNAADYAAWTKGEFLFNDMPLATVMQKLARWYNVEVDATSLPNKNLYLKITRNASIEEVLKLLSLATDMQFRLEENKILLQKSSIK